jgi:parallel beta-helix repeat protein/predicted outer membrane repeat protein
MIIMTYQVSAQRLGYRSIPITFLDALDVEIKEGEQIKYYSGWSSDKPFSSMQTVEPGYVLGTNKYSDAEHGQVYVLDGIHLLSSVYLGVHTRGVMKGAIRINVRSFGRLPGRLLGEIVWSLDSLTDGVHWQKLDFPGKTVLQGSVIISLDVRDVESGQIGLLSQHTDIDQIWTKTAEHKWKKQETLWRRPPLGATLFPVLLNRSSFAGGSGTREDPFLVETAEQLNAVRDFPSSHFVQIDDIDLGISPWNEGEGWQPIGNDSLYFTGSYSGGGFKINGLTINRHAVDYQGLFGQTASSLIWNLELKGSTVHGGNYTGILVGRALGGEILNVSVDGEVMGVDFVGGITGAIYTGWIRDCVSASLVEGVSHAGGIAGRGQLSACFASGTVNGNVSSFRLGGLLGEGQAINSRATGAVSGGTEIGGLIGRGEAIGCEATGTVQGSGDHIGGLIGELESGQFDDDSGVFGPGETSPGDTTRLQDSLHIQGNGQIEIVLEDGTRFIMEGNGSEIGAEGGRVPVDADIADFAPEWAGFRVTGSMRVLKVAGAGDPSQIKPIISIPMEEIGTINPETVVILRVGDLGVNGDLYEDHGVILPVISIENGKLKFVDAQFPECVIPDDGIGENPDARLDTWVGNVKYVLLTYDKALNWSKSPVVERMVPDTLKAEDGFRQLWRRSTREAQAKLRKKPVCNIVLLVHGHNEEEKDGYLGSKIITPWEFGYKRLVWDILYEEFLKNTSGDIPNDCTSFYEFIFPTYRPIFSPVMEKSGFRMPTLGEELGRMVNERLLQDEQIRKMLEQDMVFNLYIVAHSQGGLVSRAGLRFMDERLLKNLKQVITWGSPHRGASLYSLRYALSAGHDLVIDDIRFPMQNIGQSTGYQNGVAGIAIDAPGIRDLRWDVSKKELLRLGELMRENTATLNEFPDTELPYGRLFFSENLKIFNETEGSGVNGLLQDKYLFYQGVTPKLASLETGWFFLWRTYRFATNATSIEKGAQLNRLVMNDPHKDSDGAGPLNSQGAAGIYPGGGVRSKLFPDTDHEEFYGSEAPQRNEDTKRKGQFVALETFTDLGLTLSGSKCPVLEIEVKDNPDTLILEGRVVFPIYDIAQGGDGVLGKRILKIEARLASIDSSGIQNMQFEVEDNGNIRVLIPALEVPSDNDSLYITAIFKDGSEIYFPLFYEGKALVYNKTWKKWYATISTATQEARQGDTILVNPGIYKEYPLIAFKNIWLMSREGAGLTILDGDGGGTGLRITNSHSVVEGFTLRNFWTGVSCTEFGENETPFRPEIRNCIIQNNDGTGISVSGNCSAIIENNTILSNLYYGIDIEKLIQSSVNPVIITNNIIEDHNRGIRLRGWQTAMIENNQFKGGDWGIEILGNTGAEIRINTFQLHSADAIRIYYTSGVHPSVILGNTISGCLFGIQTDASGSITIQNNTLTNNLGGIFLMLGNNGSGNALVSNNTITGSTQAGGIMARPGSGCLSFQCTISGNTLTNNNNESNGGGGISCFTSTVGTVQIIGNTLDGNKSFNGGGVYASGNVEVKNNQILNNMATYGGGLNAVEGAVVVENYFESNSATTSGGGLECRDAVIRDNTFLSNSATLNGGAVYSPYASLISGNTFNSNYAGNNGGAIFGRATNWNATEVVTVSGMPRTVPRHFPCFNETSNVYTGNTHGAATGEWGPGTDNWCANSGFNVYSN